jgi:hypothetical protein
MPFFTKAFRCDLKKRFLTSLRKLATARNDVFRHDVVMAFKAEKRIVVKPNIRDRGRSKRSRVEGFVNCYCGENGEVIVKGISTYGFCLKRAIARVSCGFRNTGQQLDLDTVQQAVAGSAGLSNTG